MIVEEVDDGLQAAAGDAKLMHLLGGGGFLSEDFGSELVEVFGALIPRALEDEADGCCGVEVFTPFACGHVADSG